MRFGSQGKGLPRSPSTHGIGRLVRRYRRNGMAVVGIVLLFAIHMFAVVGPAFVSHSYEATNALATFQPPSADHWLGTDEVGRDILVRLMHGTRVSLLIAWSAVALSVLIGTVFGLLSGYFGGRTDALIMRVTDTFMAVPTFFVLLLVMALFGSGIPTMILAIGLTSWMQVARVVRSDALRTRALPFVEAVRALGASNPRVLAWHIQPQAVPSIIVAATLGIANAILVESALSYLGLGVQPPRPSLGNMLQNAQNYIWISPALAIYPGALIMVVVLAYNWIGDGLRDALDPKLDR